MKKSIALIILVFLILVSLGATKEIPIAAIITSTAKLTAELKKKEKYTKSQLWKLHEEKNDSLRRLLYIERFKETAVDMQERFNIIPAISIAQGILESRSGGSKLTLYAKNHFGIKGRKGCKSCKSWNTEEYRKGIKKSESAIFRRFNTHWDSYLAHSKMLREGRNFQNLKAYWIPRDEWQRMSPIERIAIIDKIVLHLGPKSQRILGQKIDVPRGCGYATDLYYYTKIMDIVLKHKLYEI